MSTGNADLCPDPADQFERDRCENGESAGAASAADCPTAFLDLVRMRRSCRAYDPSRTVSRELILRCVEAARQAPSACNKQPWRFVIVTDAGLRKSIWRDARLPGIDHRWLRDAPVIVVLCLDLNLVTHRLAPGLSGIPYHLIDAGIAGEHFVLAATELGLGTCWIGWFKAKKVKQILSIPRHVRAVSLISLGYPAADADGNGANSGRLLPDDICFFETWHA